MLRKKKKYKKKFNRPEKKREKKIFNLFFSVFVFIYDHDKFMITVQYSRINTKFIRFLCGNCLNCKRFMFITSVSVKTFFQHVIVSVKYDF